MDGQFIVFFLALGVPLVFGACIGAAFRGRFGRGLGLVTLALGLAGLLYGALTFTTYRDGYGLFAWVLQILMAGGVFCPLTLPPWFSCPLPGVGAVAAPRGRQCGYQRGICRT